MRLKSIPQHMNAFASVGAFAFLVACSLASATTLSSTATTLSGVNVATNGIAPPATVLRTQPITRTPNQPASGISAAPGITASSQRIFKVLVSATQLEAGTVLAVVQEGASNNQSCGSEVYLTRVGPGASQIPDGFKLISQNVNLWPKIQKFQMIVPGHYVVHLRMTDPAPTCGYTHPGNISGDLTDIEVTPTVVAN